MKIKEGVNLIGLKLPMRKVLMTADKLWKQYGKELVITSALDGVHSAGSMHYYGYAVDLRTRYFTEDVIKDITNELSVNLGDQYLVLNEGDHIHVQYRYVYAVSNEG